MESDSPEVNVLCGVSRWHAFGPLFFAEKIVTEQEYLKMLQNCLISQLTQQEFIFRSDGAPTHWHMCSRIPQWKPTRSCISRRQHVLHMATPVAGPDSVWFLPLWFRQGQCLLPHFPRRFRNGNDASTVPARMSRKTFLGVKRLARMGVQLGHLPRHKWCTHRISLRQLRNYRHFSSRCQ
jgi:hypothetical protein